MLNLIIGARYGFTLASGRSVEIVVHGQNARGTWDIAVDGVRAGYADINHALEEPFTQVAALP